MKPVVIILLILVGLGCGFFLLYAVAWLVMLGDFST
jgi:hypothetical protein